MGIIQLQEYPYTQPMIHRIARSTIRTHINHNLSCIEFNLSNKRPTLNINYQLLHCTYHEAPHRRGILRSSLVSYNFHSSSKHKAEQGQQIFRTRLNCVETEVNKNEDAPNQVAAKTINKDVLSQVITQLTKFATNIPKSNNRLQTIEQYREIAGKHLKSSQFKEYLNIELKNQKPESLVYAVNKICTKIKSHGLELQDTDQYLACSILASQLFKSIPLATHQLISIANTISQKVIAMEEQIRVERAELAKQMENNQESTTSAQSANPQFSDKNDLVKKPQCTKSLVDIKLSLLDLSTIMSNLTLIPKDLYRPLFQIFLDRENGLSYFVHSNFMLECVANEFDLDADFLKRYHQKTEHNLYRTSYRYAYLCFINYYMEKSYMPMFSALEDGRRSFFSHEFSQRFDVLYKYVKLIAFEYAVGMKSGSRFCFQAYNRRINQLDNFLSGDFLSYFQIIKLYNVLASVCSLGMSIVNNGILKDLTANEQNIDELKLFVLNFMKNLQPQYIYSPLEEKVTNEVSQQMLGRLYFISNQILKHDPAFLIQITTLLQFSGKKTVQYRNYLFHDTSYLNNTIYNLIEASETHKNAPIIVSDTSSEIRQKFYKIMNFLEKNNQLIEFKNLDFSKFLNDLYRQFMNLDQKKIKQFSNSQWKLLFQTCFLLSKYESTQPNQITNTRLLKLYKKFCEPYIQENQSKKQDNLIRQPKLFEQQILRIAYLVKKYFKGNQSKQKQMVNFINNNFIYTAKSIIKDAIFDIIFLLDQFNGINPQVYAYLYSNLSTFIIYLKVMQRFYLNVGKNLANIKSFHEVLLVALKNYKILQNVQNKQKIRILKMLACLFWNKLENRQIAQLLIILGNNHMVTSQISDLVYRVKFTASDIAGLDPDILASFKLRNKSLASLLAKKGTEIADKDDFVLSDTKTQQQLKRMFEDKQVYQLAMETPSFTNQHLIPPPPEGAQPRVKMIYVCLKIVNKLRKERDFSMSALKKQLETNQSETRLMRRQNRQKEVNLSEQIQYIKENGLIKLKKENQFKLGDNQQTAHYEMIECWNYSDEFSNLSQLSGYINAYSEIDISEEVMLLLIGNFGLIRKLVKDQMFFPEIARVIKQLKLEFAAKGCLMAINQPGRRQEEIYVFCSKRANIKLHIIFAYILSQMRFHVCIAEERINLQSSIRALLKQAFKKIEPKPKPETETVLQTQEVAS